MVTPTVSFNLTTPLVFFRFFMQPWKAGVEMLNLRMGCRKGGPVRLGSLKMLAFGYFTVGRQFMNRLQTAGVTETFSGI